ncbi:ABC transporter ATP-binding protein [Desulfoprunum benzoelyticum]|uniref:Iron(III) transport system ATP-binding protein n=1 Tax=Desulfoprunum benzoelyticum TaxID=1506996 RepID=A0A840UVW5_9BACT|nr:ABC transporter ATP-binding protein [Desulfoprunum benzoelyticum]MBB5346858.1 iron(III) transport system ATP-binding protein [Desulfoprunum benzoelyticum]MBM9529480.1 ABC transporter ATP-binding protein [Desulfoprunum benzoelyticum]
MEIRITGLRKHYASDGRIIKALDDVDLTIPSNQIFTLLGPSGCGKTTLLRSIVGLESPDAGEIRIGDDIVYSSAQNISLPTEKRGLGMVFQTYAIWPHMNVYDNVAYPLQNRKVPKEEIRRRVAETLAFVQLEGYENRPATKLSGGQQQRVALARALVAKPRVILFDEPLSNLDAKLREETRKELKTFLYDLQITAVYVTHDRVEALALSDTIAVMRTGRIIEIGSPKKIYFDAESEFVADFIGRANLVKAVVRQQLPGTTIVDSGIGRLSCRKGDFPPDTKVTLCLRPEFISLARGDHPGTNVVQGTIVSMVFVGDAFEGEIRVGDQHLLARIEPETDLAVGDEVGFQVSPDHCLLVAG